jgi:hypothetical protein
MRRNERSILPRISTKLMTPVAGRGAARWYSHESRRYNRLIGFWAPFFPQA